MYKRLSLLCLFFFIPISGFSGPMWHCTATSAKEAVWNAYGHTRDSARFYVENQCMEHNKHQYCELVCFPPRIYWRCLSHDTLPNPRDIKSDTQLQQGTWYWASFSKQVAINGARDACRHNSAFGGCYVDPKACASS